MKKIILILIMSVILIECSHKQDNNQIMPVEQADTHNGWKVGKLLDQFGAPTDKQYLYNTFDDGDNGLIVKCTYIGRRIELTYYEYGHKIKDFGMSEIDLKDESGNISHFYAYSNEGMSFSTIDSDSLISLLITNETLKAAARFSESGKGKLVSFRMKGTKNLLELLESQK